MPDTYKHGVYYSELDTLLVPIRMAPSAMPVVVGTAKGPDAQNPPLNEAKICYNMGDYQKYFGWAGTLTNGVFDYTLEEFAKVFFTLHGMGPAVFVNVYDPDTHVGGVGDVTGTDIVGAQTAGVNSGLFCVEDVFPKFGLVPGLILAPGWSHESAVGAAMIARATDINGVFNALAILDLPTTVTDPANASAEKGSLSYTDARSIVCWPRVTSGSEIHWLSSHVAGRIGQTDWAHRGIPYASPSNKRLPIDGMDGVIYGRNVANDSLNANGIVTVQNWGGAGWVLWGNRTGAYPGETDVKDTFIPIRRTFDYIGNSFVLTFQGKVDFPINRRLIDTIVDSANVWLNGLVGEGALLGGKVYFLPDDNPSTDIMDGKIKFRFKITPPSPARDIEAVLEYDVDNLETLFTTG